MTTYSAFFSSGLLAAPHMYSSHSMYNSSPRFDASSLASMPSISPSLLHPSDVIDDMSDVELDRSSTPTPASIAVPEGQQTRQDPPRLRRRRSSLTAGTSPMNHIKSPSRSAGNALQFQRHLLASPGRARSGSASSVLSIGEETGYQGTTGNVASERTSLLGRMRSGSVGTALKPRRAVRRVPGPSFPPPSAPLPPLPPIPGTPSRTKAFSLAIPASASRSLAQKLANETASDLPALQTAGASPSPPLPSPRQVFGEIQLHGYGRDQEMRN